MSSNITELLHGIYQDVADWSYTELFRFVRSLVESILVFCLLIEAFVMVTKDIPNTLDAFLVNHDAKLPLRISILFALCVTLFIIHVFEVLLKW